MSPKTAPLFNKRGKDYPVSHSLHSFGLKKFIKRGGVKEELLLAEQSPPSVSQIPGLFWGNPVNRHLSNTSGVLIWKLVWNCVLFSFSFFKETKGEGWEVKHPPKKPLQRLQESSSRERVKVEIRYQSVCPEEIKESSSWWKVDEGEKKIAKSSNPTSNRKNGDLKSFNCGSQGWWVENWFHPTWEWRGCCRQLSRH